MTLKIKITQIPEPDEGFVLCPIASPIPTVLEEITLKNYLTLIEAPIGNAIAFNGKSDAIFVNSNSLMDLSQFTVEVIFQPDAGGLKEQRFLHMGENHDQFCE
jgi:hypothetical protein